VANFIALVTVSISYQRCGKAGCCFQPFIYFCVCMYVCVSTL